MVSRVLRQDLSGVLKGKHKGRGGAGGVRGGRVDPQGAKSDWEGSIHRVEDNESLVAVVWGHSSERGGDSGWDTIDGDT